MGNHTAIICWKAHTSQLGYFPLRPHFRFSKKNQTTNFRPLFEVQNGALAPPKHPFH